MNRNSNGGNAASATLKAPIMEYENALPFDLRTLAETDADGRVHAMRQRLNDLFEVTDFLTSYRDTSGRVVREWSLTPPINVPFDGEDHLFQLARRSDLNDDEDRREDTFLISYGVVDSPLAEYDVEVDIRPNEKLVDTTRSIDEDTINRPDLVDFYESILTTTEVELDGFKAQIEATKSAEARARADAKRQRLFRLKEVRNRVAGTLLGLSILAGIGFGTDAIISAAHDSPDEIAQANKLNAKMASSMPGKSYVKVGSKVKMVELKGDKAIVTLQESAPKTGGATLDLDAKDPVPFDLGGEISAPTDKNKVVEFDLPTEKGECTVVATPTPTDRQARIVGAKVMTSDRATGDFTVQMIRRNTDLSTQSANKIARIAAAKVCKVGNLQNDPNGDEVTTGWLQMVDNAHATRR